MKRTISLLWLLTLTCLLPAQVVSDDSGSETDTTPRLIERDFEIPAYSLYQQDWNHDHVRAKSLSAILGNNTNIKIILVEDNNPFVAPLRHLAINSPYGIRKGRPHTGIDLAANLNDSVFCCFDGVVRMAKEYSGYGNTVVVRHYNGLETVYAHLNAILVQPNQIVTSGTLLGLAGHSGRATGNHLHFETRFLYEHFDPATMIDFDEGEIISNILVINKENLLLDNQNEEEENSSTQTEDATVHIVQEGDTLYAISRKYHVSLEQLYQMNHLTEESIIKVGQKIKIR